MEIELLRRELDEKIDGDEERDDMNNCMERELLDDADYSETN